MIDDGEVMEVDFFVDHYLILIILQFHEIIHHPTYYQDHVISMQLLLFLVIFWLIFFDFHHDFVLFQTLNVVIFSVFSAFVLIVFYLACDPQHNLVQNLLNLPIYILLSSTSLADCISFTPSNIITNHSKSVILQKFLQNLFFYGLRTFDAINVNYVNDDRLIVFDDP